LTVCSRRPIIQKAATGWHLMLVCIMPPLSGRLPAAVKGLNAEVRTARTFPVPLPRPIYPGKFR
jgi:hypothetical protein